MAAPLFLHAAPALADTAVDMQVWGAAFFTAKLTGREPGATGLSAWLDLHARRGGAGVVSIIRPALGYRFTGWFSAFAGYGSIGVFDDNPDTRAQEHRIFEQALFDGSLGPITLQLRPRLEQRFRDGQSDIAHRLRVFGRANVGFGASLVLLATWNEAFYRPERRRLGPAHRLRSKPPLPRDRHQGLPASVSRQAISTSRAAAPPASASPTTSPSTLFHQLPDPPMVSPRRAPRPRCSPPRSPPRSPFSSRRRRPGDALAASPPPPLRRLRLPARRVRR
ncbi:MAG: DUF2490 domain-containing protein [Polyangiaceae bacterium]